MCVWLCVRGGLLQNSIFCALREKWGGGGVNKVLIYSIKKIVSDGWTVVEYWRARRDQRRAECYFELLSVRVTFLQWRRCVITTKWKVRFSSVIVDRYVIWVFRQTQQQSEYVLLWFIHIKYHIERYSSVHLSLFMVDKEIRIFICDRVKKTAIF